MGSRWELLLLGWALLVVLLVLLAAATAEVGTRDGDRNVRQQAAAARPPSAAALQVYSEAALQRAESGIILITLSDGSVAAVDTSSGIVKWRSKLGSPLFFSSFDAPPHAGTAAEEGLAGHAEIPDGNGTDEDPEYSDPAQESPVLDGDAKGVQQHGRFIPGADGMLYEYSKSTGLQELSYSVRDLVQSSPSITGDGELIVGSRSTTVVLLDTSTGNVLHSFNTSDILHNAPTKERVEGSFLAGCVRQQRRAQRGEKVADQSEAADMPTEAERDQCQRLWDSAVYLTRTDYVLKSYELATGTLRWNVTYGELSALQGSDRLFNFKPSVSGRSDVIFDTAPDPAASTEDGDSDGPSVVGEEYGALMSTVERHQQLAGQHSKGTIPDPREKLEGASGVGPVVQHRLAPAGMPKEDLLEFVMGDQSCGPADSEGGPQGAPEYCVRMKDRVTGEELWSVSLPSVPLSAFSSSGRVVQNFVQPADRTQSWASVLFLPPSSDQPGSTFVLPQSVAARRSSSSQVAISPAGRSGKYTVPAVARVPGNALVPLGSRPRRPSSLESLACDATGHEGVPGMPGLISLRDPHAAATRFNPSARLAPGLTEDCGDACAQPPLPAPAPARGLFTLASLSYATVLLAALAVGIAAAVKLVQWGQRRVRQGAPAGKEGGQERGEGKARSGGGPGNRRRRRGQGHGKGRGQSQGNGDQEGAEDCAALGPEAEEENGPVKGANGSLESVAECEATVFRTPEKERDEVREGLRGGSGGLAQGCAKGWSNWEREGAPSLGADAVRVGRLRVGTQVIGYGSHGTLVLEGELEGRPVAVKRLLSQFYEKARKEIAALIATDEHPSVVRCFAMEEDGAFVYVALERCTMSLADLITACARAQAGSTTPWKEGNGTPGKGAIAANGGPGLGCRGDSGGFDAGADSETAAAAAEVAQRVHLWDDAGFPTPTLVGLMRDIVDGLSHLHSQRIVHRDLKPQNVLVLVQRQLQGRRRARDRERERERGPCGAEEEGLGQGPAECVALRVRAKLSDMGISKRLADEASSYDQHTAGSGSSGWQAPEQLAEGQRQTRSVDLFPLGCLLFYCVSAGRHPFGSRYERDANVLCGRCDLFPVEHVPEAEHLIALLLQKDPDQRPTAAEVLAHPLMWSAETRLSFLKDASDRVEREDRVEGGSPLLDDLEGAAQRALGAGQWRDRIDGALLGNLGMYRRYNFRSVRDLLRVIRNKCNHYRELPEDVQALFGTMPEGYEEYFRKRFPHLLMEVYLVLRYHCLDDHVFSKYFGDQDSRSAMY